MISVKNQSVLEYSISGRRERLTERDVRNVTAVSHKHRHAPHTRHIDLRTDIMGPR